jgi:predicted NBD/HSP70 family sugar kinase
LIWVAQELKRWPSTESGNILHQYYHPTLDGDDSVWKNAVAAAVREIQDKIESPGAVVGISAPGLPNTDNSAIAFMPGRLQGLENFDWTGFLGVRTFVLNDAISAMMAEARFGAAKDRKNVAMLTLGPALAVHCSSKENLTRALSTRQAIWDTWLSTAMGNGI